MNEELIISVYLSGYGDIEAGRPFDPPDNILLRKAYCEGWQDWAMGVLRDDREVIEMVSMWS